MTIQEEILQKSQRAGGIAKEVREEARRTVREGMPIIDLCEKVEHLIRKKGGKPAFPCNVSVNEVAAHYTSPPRDKRIIPKRSLVKIDIGVHVDGYIADTAITVCFNTEYDNLVHAAEEALKKAVEILRPGLSISRFGSTIQQIIKSYGLKPVSNLTGHLIKRYGIHAGKSLPNVFSVSTSRLSLGEIYGVEPFVTVPEAAGKVRNGKEAHIFRFNKNKSLRNPYARQLLNHIKENFYTLPFTERWLQECLPHNNYEAAFSDLLTSKCIVTYPILVEARGKPVAQAEHTVLIVRDGCAVLT